MGVPWNRTETLEERVTLFVAFPNDYVGGVIGKGGLGCNVGDTAAFRLVGGFSRLFW